VKLSRVHYASLITSIEKTKERRAGAKRPRLQKSRAEETKWSNEIKTLRDKHSEELTALKAKQTDELVYIEARKSNALQVCSSSCDAELRAIIEKYQPKIIEAEVERDALAKTLGAKCCDFCEEMFFVDERPSWNDKWSSIHCGQCFMGNVHNQGPVCGPYVHIMGPSWARRGRPQPT
jgi:hypothetical protein